MSTNVVWLIESDALFYVFNARSDRVSAFNHLLTIWLLWGAIALSIALKVAVVPVPFLNEAKKLVQWLLM